MFWNFLRHYLIAESFNLRVTGRQLILADMVQESPVSSGFGMTISVSDAGKQWLSRSAGKPVYLIKPSNDLAPFLKYGTAPSTSTNSYQEVVSVVTTEPSNSYSK